MSKLPMLNARKVEIQEVGLDEKPVRTLISGLDEMPTALSSSPRQGPRGAPLDQVAD